MRIENTVVISSDEVMFITRNMRAIALDGTYSAMCEFDEFGIYSAEFSAYTTFSASLFRT